MLVDDALKELVQPLAQCIILLGQVLIQVLGQAASTLSNIN